jgi:hypothetical protein
MSEPSSPVARFFNDNGLSLALLALFVPTLAGQAAMGWRAFNAARNSAHLPVIGFGGYLGTGNFLDGLFSNWQAAALQLAVLISFGAVLRQKGATHSRQPGDDGDPGRGNHGWIYAHSLSLAFAVLSLATFAAHLVCGAMKYNEDQQLQHLPPIALGMYAKSAAFWFSVFQCWEAEFAVIGIYVVFSILLRQEASPESKPVTASDEQTGGANE